MYIYLQCVRVIDSKGPLSFIKSFDYHLLGCITWHFDDTMDIPEAIFRVQNGPNSASCQRIQLTWKSVSGKNNFKIQPLEWLLGKSICIKYPPKRSKKHDLFIWVCSIFPPSPGCSGRVSSAFIAQRLAHAMLKEKKMRNKKHTKTLTSEIVVLTAWLLSQITCESSVYQLSIMLKEAAIKDIHLCHLVSTSGNIKTCHVHGRCVIFVYTNWSGPIYGRLEHCQNTAEWISFRVITVRTKTLSTWTKDDETNNKNLFWGKSLWIWGSVTTCDYMWLTRMEKIPIPKSFQIKAPMPWKKPWSEFNSSIRV